MAYQEMLVHLDESRNCPARLTAAVTLAQALGARLTGLSIMPSPDLLLKTSVSVTAESIAAERQAAKEKADRQQELFKQAVESVRLNSEWRCVTGEASHQVNYHARFHDLVIIGQTDRQDPNSLDGGFVNHVVLGAGRPVLLIPYIGPRPSLGQRILVAWNGSKEAARAIFDALPLLDKAKQVTLLTIATESGTEAESSGEELCHYLGRRGIPATAVHLPAGDLEVGDLLLDRAADEDFDLIVMGAYGHARLREIILGGATRHLLEHMTVPVLLSH
ncbi:MAG: universal stress protein [Candidatus Competibacteraceae bacterium]